MDSKLVLLIIIIALGGVIIGRQFQRTIDFFRKLNGARAALPGMERDAKSNFWTFVKWAAILVFLAFVLSHLTFK